MNERLINELKDAVLRRRRGLPLADGADLEELLEQAAAEIEHLSYELEKLEDHHDSCPFAM